MSSVLDVDVVGSCQLFGRFPRQVEFDVHIFLKLQESVISVCEEKKREVLVQNPTPLLLHALARCQ
jgi:hypothetical protein